MPELPEVETIRNDLQSSIIGNTLVKISILWPKMVLRHTVEELLQQLIGQKIKQIGRRGKYLIFHLSNGNLLLLHMRMTGAILLTDQTTDPINYITAVFYLDNGKQLCFCDRRKLGTLSIIQDIEELEIKLGPEPLAHNFTSEVLKFQLRDRKAPIKAILCDQKAIAGIGNMYADDVLFTARIHPLRQSNSFTDLEIKILHLAIQEVLRKGIYNSGASFSDYQRPDGKRGNQQNEFLVAHRGGKNCYICATPIERIRVRNRGTYFCPTCQT